jgi:hypothetical protein
MKGRAFLLGTLGVFIDEASEGGPLTCCTLAWI